MKDPKELTTKAKPGTEENRTLPKSPLDLWRMMGGQAERVRSQPGRSMDGMLAVYRDRLTYTFIIGHEVASIHFNRLKKEIYFKGHNIQHCELDASKRKALEGLKEVLKTEERAKPFLADYEATLARVFADNSK